MAHFVYPAGTPLGTVPALYVLPSADWQTTIQQVFKAINGDDGGTWAPGQFITVGGSGLQLTGTGHELAGSARLTLQSLAQIRVENGAGILLNASSGDIDIEVASNVAQIVVHSGAKIEVDGDLNVYSQITLRNTNGPGAFNAEDNTVATFESGSELEIEAGALLEVAGDLTVLSGGDVSLESGSEFAAGAGSFCLFTGEAWFSNATFVSNAWPKLGPTRNWERTSLLLAMTSYETTAAATPPVDPHAWKIKSDQSTADMIETAYQPDEWLIEFTDLPIGGTITEVEIVTRGVGDVTDLPTYQIVKWQSGDSGLTAISAVVADAHTGVNWDVANVTTTIAANASTVVGQGYRYGLRCTGPSHAIAPGSALKIYRCAMQGTAVELQI